MMAARPRTEVRTVASRAELPTHDLADESYVELDDGTIEFEDYARSGLGRLLHPEIASAVWAQTRAWLLRKKQVEKFDLAGAWILPARWPCPASR
jgi:hypothetical protein